MARHFVRSSSQKLLGSAPVTAAPLTIAVWFKPTATGVAYRIIQLDDGTDSNRFVLSSDSTSRINAFSAAASNGNAVTTTTYSSGVWSHACAVFASSTDRRAFLNGGGKGTDTASSTPSGINALGIGCGTVNTLGMDGDLDIPCIWDIALSDAEIALLATGISPLFIHPEAIICYPPLEAGYSPEIDIVGGLTFTVTGATVVGGTDILRPTGAKVNKAIVQKWPLTATLAGVGALTAPIIHTPQLAATLAGIGAVTAPLTHTVQVNAALAGAGGLSINVSHTPLLAATLAGQGSLSANFIPDLKATLNGVGTLTVNVTHTPRATAQLNGQGALNVDIKATKFLQATMAGHGAMSASIMGQDIINTPQILAGHGALFVDMSLLKGAISDAMRQSVFAQETCDVFTVLVTIEHPTLAGGPFRVCGDSRDIVSRGNTYFAYPFTVALPDANPDSPPKAKITIDNVSREITNALRSITSPATITFEVIRSSDPDVVEISMPDYTLNSVQYDALTISGDLGVEQFLLEPYPASMFTPNSFPGLF